MGVERDQAGWEMLETIRFQIEIANCFVNSSNDVVVTTMSIDEMRTRYPSVPWLEFLHKIFPSKEYLTIEEKLQVYYPYYLECFTTLVNNTDQRTIANYAGWQAVASSAEYLNEFARNLKFEREGMISGCPIDSAVARVH
ncbi:Endothelin-converting enzyme 1 [Orchesella cincta]|uniref:Endothelin-converting enzyme 1 n=1 Tax=Orchesella cincta TaxID=48709 RepID=A0A1D2MQI7_ORCCI|nr:Endothelin-converting enzyme 1 [Orchesella cincta]